MASGLMNVTGEQVLVMVLYTDWGYLRRQMGTAPSGTSVDVLGE